MVLSRLAIALLLAASALLTTEACRSVRRAPPPSPTPVPTATPTPAPSPTATVTPTPPPGGTATPSPLPLDTTPALSIYERTPGVLHEEKGKPPSPVAVTRTPRRKFASPASS
jgi:hypothetical protein